ncbi:hypothetical protein VB620_08970 [Nodularia harveyana UHCC-0300]|uniref:Uncharacterized protein n=1 Tax=Nodularia harveyana UHCC-0300 TaxID=2974287 RepID=A0ABU5UE75_9CYAN|nr:hypothetical protein [Nodularia harveyana]MEA5581469.1 hypothetical protein [Nodularia harveyana UHCC-0300]
MLINTSVYWAIARRYAGVIEDLEKPDREKVSQQENLQSFFAYFLSYFEVSIILNHPANLIRFSPSRQYNPPGQNQ